MPLRAAPRREDASEKDVHAYHSTGPRVTSRRDVANKVVYLDAGVLVERGKPEEIFTSPQHESTRIFLERVR